MLWFDPSAKLQQLTPQRDLAEGIDRLVYPAANRWLTLEPLVGTDVVFFCRGDADFDAERCLEEHRIPLPLPPQNYLKLRRSQVTVSGPREPHGPDGDAIAKATEYLQDLNRCLGPHFKGMTAIAFPRRVADQKEQRPAGDDDEMSEDASDSD